LIQKGKFMALDTPLGIVNSFKYRLLAINASNRYRLLQDLREWNNTDSAFGFGQDFHVTFKNDRFEKEELFRYLSEKGHIDIRIEEFDPGIEDVFMKLMGTPDKPQKADL
ncbi:MAG: ABC transporter ATP-binding protein, partial [Bacteroidota bacterium]|nr:ABC transporter ATP-binding protein [Bacteroidota bacterium]